MRCPSCGADNSSKVIDSRSTEAGAVIRRRRVCQDCNRRYTTKERVEEELRLAVIKNGGQREPYNRENVVRGIEKACHKLPVSEQQILELADRVEEELFKHHEREVTTERIGRYVGDVLRKLHPVAYVRFMSVHRKFASVEQFVEEIRDVQARSAEDAPTQRLLFEQQDGKPAH